MKLNICLLRRHLCVTWPHCVTVHDFLALLTDPDFLHKWDFSQRDGSDSTCVRQARARSSKQNTRTNISVFCLHIWPSIRSKAINCFNKYVWRLLTLEGMIKKREGIWHVFRVALHNSGIGGWRHDNSPWRACCHVSIRQSPSLCNAILNTCPCLLTILTQLGPKLFHQSPHKIIKQIDGLYATLGKWELFSNVDTNSL